MQKPKAKMDKETRKWLSSHTVFYLGLSVDEIEEIIKRIEKQDAETKQTIEKP